MHASAHIAVVIVNSASEALRIFLIRPFPIENIETILNI